jgi:hypothetical protein
MPIIRDKLDPRTLQEVKDRGKCHLIPKGILQRPEHVWLERKFDNDVGRVCDVELINALHTYFCGILSGQASFAGGSNHITANLTVRGRLEIGLGACLSFGLL